MSTFIGQSGLGTLNAVQLQQSDDRTMPKWHRWDYDGGREQLDFFADGMLWPRSRMLGSDGGASFSILAAGDTLGNSRWESDNNDCTGGAQVKKIIGTTFDSTGAVLGNCVVKGFVTSTNVCVGQVTSDPGGYYELPTTFAGLTHYCVAYQVGSPDVSGTTVNTIVPV